MIQFVVSRSLGIPSGLVRVEQGDTDSGPYDQGVGGSNVTDCVSGAL